MNDSTKVLTTVRPTTVRMIREDADGAVRKISSDMPAGLEIYRGDELERTGSRFMYPVARNTYMLVDADDVKVGS